MKKIFGIMVSCGMVLAIATAGGLDSGVIGAERIIIQSAVAVVMICVGGYFMRRGVRV